MEALEIIEKYNSYGMITPEEKIELGDFCPDEESFDAIKFLLNQSLRMPKEEPSKHVKANLDHLFASQFPVKSNPPTYRKLTLYATIGIAASLGFILTMRIFNFDNVTPKQLSSVEKQRPKVDGRKKEESPITLEKTEPKPMEQNLPEIQRVAMDEMNTAMYDAPEPTNEWHPEEVHGPAVVEYKANDMEDVKATFKMDSDNRSDEVGYEVATVAQKNNKIKAKTLSEVDVKSKKNKKEESQTDFQTDEMLNAIFALY